MSYCRSSSARGKVIGKKRIFRDTSSTDRMPSTSKGESDPKYGVGFFFFVMLLGLRDLSSLTSDSTLSTALKVKSPNHWTTQEV